LDELLEESKERIQLFEIDYLITPFSRYFISKMIWYKERCDIKLGDTKLSNIEKVISLYHTNRDQQLQKNTESNSFQPQKNEMPDQEITKNPVIFNDVFIKHFYVAFDDYLWEPTDIESMKNWFRVNPIGMPMFKKNMITYFCYAINISKGKLITKHKPANFNNWINPTINGSNFSSLTSQATNLDKIGIIKERLSLLK
jgi:hypothetical protein